MKALFILSFFAAGFFAGILTLAAIVMWYCKDGGQIIIRGEQDV